MPIQNTAREVEPVLLRPFPSTADAPLGHKRVTPHVLRRVGAASWWPGAGRMEARPQHLTQSPQKESANEPGRTGA